MLAHERLSNAAGLLVIAFALLCSSASSASGGVLLNGTGKPVAKTYFGMHAHRLGEPTPWPDGSVGALRTWDAKVRWADLQPAESVWDFSRLDRIVDGALVRGIDVLIPLGMPPAWASSSPTEESAYRPGEAAVPRSMDLWRSFVRTVGMRYRGKVKTYEIWNEPNLPKFFSGTTTDAIALTCEARRILKEVDPSIRVVSPSATSDYGISWLTGFLAGGGGACVDVLGYHFYNKHQDPESSLDLIESVRHEMAKAGVSTLPLWNTETGWLIYSSQRKVAPGTVGFKSGARVLSDDESVSLVARTLLLYSALGVERFYWYSLDNDMMGLVERDGAHKSAWRAYQATAKLMSGRIVGPCRSNDSRIWSCDIKSSRLVVAARAYWHTANNGGDKLPIPQASSHYEVLGRGTVSAASAQNAYDAGFVVIEWLAK